MFVLDTTKAHELGYIDSLGGLFRGENAEIVGEGKDGNVLVTLPNSLSPEKEYEVGRDCLTEILPTPGYGGTCENSRI